ncbi:MAG: hypothetical protein EOO90_07140 [Pedobacter sp.]|nr:MAG: hypothetical protein EOO90_07140 [Pedobacter sp.]
MRILIFCLLASIQWFNAFAQSDLIGKMKEYASAKPTSNFFVHFDKNIYSNNETIYFTAYLLKPGKTPLAMHKVMSIAIYREADSLLIADRKFLVNDGLSFGSVSLPDSVVTGNYHIIAYTNMLQNGIPEMIFSQPITIKSSFDPTFKTNIKLLPPSPNNPMAHQIMVSASTGEGRFLSKPALVSYRYGKTSKHLQTDASGQVLLNIVTPSEIEDPNLYVKVRSGKDSSFISLDLPITNSKAKVKFYPEGGNMVYGISSNISWEVKDMTDRPMPLMAYLYKDQLVIDTIETSSYGIGRFSLTPELDANYHIKLIHSGLKDSVYTLPKPLATGLVLSLPESVVTDTLKITLKGKTHAKINLIVHNYQEVFLNVPFQKDFDQMRLRLPLNEIPKGLYTLTITDSLNRPLAERLFFAHYDQKETISVSTSENIYKQREKVKLNLQLVETDNALVSIAVVQESRFDAKKNKDILSYAYLNNELQSLPIPLKGSAYKDRDYFEQVLAVKGWRRYTWQEMEERRPSDQPLKLDSLSIIGKILRSNKELKKTLTIGTLGGVNHRLISTKIQGDFELSNEALLTAYDKKLYIFINGGEQQASNLKINIDDQFSTLNLKLPKLLNHEKTNLPSKITNNTELVLKNNEKAIKLKEVVITAKKSDGQFNSLRGTNACGDYVCPNNILNCVNHPGNPGNRQPQKGVSYMTNGLSIPYGGCSTPDHSIFTIIKGIHQAKEFYENDYKEPNEPAFFSTLYWNYGLILSSKKATELSFHTSDITGKFRVVVQGISNKDLIYVEHSFEVKQK